VGVTDSITRMMIIKFTDGGANLTSVQVGLYLEAVAASNTVMYPQNPLVFDPVTRARFKVIYDRSIVLNNNNDTQLVKKTFKLNGKMNFQPGSSTFASNGYIVYFISDSSGTNAASINFRSRLLFKDI
ncbi:hypothetical protein, partial [Rheinheimera sp.]|uniref:hypothetical protein n=1 Tax=Rheinheimera sp. TaxID=1869214 RepID=UPI004047E774